MKDALVLFIAQLVVCIVVVIGIRGIALNHMRPALGAEIIISSLNFGVMWRVARMVEARSLIGFIGYVLGSVIGTWLGMLL